ncbi:MAG: CTP synthetase [Flammeovirgaceae bacterium]|nr:CTP synthetase [Flammeovirgaceae bacterium]
MKKKKFIFVTGGVTSSLGKGIISASIGVLLKSAGYKVTIQKFDPYLNIDPGTMNPYEHGECYVTEDGAETDLDLGHYERFLDIKTSQDNNVTTGRIYNNVINKERKGKFLGKTVQVIPHITDEIKNSFYKISNKNNIEIIITEIGGCIGDIESLPFFEAVRQAKFDLGSSNFLCIHLTLIPYLHASGELKTKPTQHSVKRLLEAGIQPDILVCRTQQNLNMDIRNKLALFCNLLKKDVIESIDTDSIYKVPLLMKKENLHKRVLSKLNLNYKKPIVLNRWNKFLKNLKNPLNIINIAIVGKYIELHDAYKSIAESLIHAGVKLFTKINLKWVSSEKINSKNIFKKFENINGILVAPGFGSRGINGKIMTVKFARENKVPFFGICLGMQCACIEFARNVLNIKNANSTEFKEKTKNPIINLMEDQKSIKIKGGTMRLGSYKCRIKKNSLAFNSYRKNNINERHRHRYEFNNKYLNEFEKEGMISSGFNESLGVVEIIELKNHPWFLGTQYHPEYKSTVLNPHPLFINFIKSIVKLKNGK